MSFSIVDSKVKNYTKPIYDLVINREQVQAQSPVQVQTQVQSQPPLQFQSPVVQTETVVNQPFILEKRKPFQLKSRDRFQARRTISQPVSEPTVIVQTVFEPPVVVQPVPLVQIPSQVENQEQFDELTDDI